MDSNKSINFLNWNARSLLGNEDEFFNFLRTHNIDVAVITETFLKPCHSLKRDPNYKIFRNDRLEGAGGGVAIAIRGRIKHKILPSFNTRVIETLGIEIETDIGKFTIIAAYLPFQCSGEQKNFFKGDLQKLTRNKSKFFVAGDFNSKHRSWNNLQNNSNGNILFDDCSAGYYTIEHPNSPTCFSSIRNPSTIDLVLTDLGQLCSQSITHADFDSDHLPVTFSVSQDAIENPSKLVFNFQKADWERYQNFVERDLDVNLAVNTKSDIDSALDHLTSSIVNARAAAVPRVQIKFDSPLIDDDLQQIIRLKNIRRRQYQRTHDPLYKTIYKELEKEIKRRFAIIRNDQFSKAVEDIKPYSKPFWKLTKILKKPQKPIPTLKDGDHLLLTNREKSQKLAKQFESAHNFNLNTVSPIEGEVNQECQIVFNCENSFDTSCTTNVDELKSLLRKFKNMKAPGDDGIFYILIKRLPESSIQFLVNIFNRCLSLAYFPEKWKNAKVTPILKPDKNPAEASSYRPISLLSSISKLFERVILSRMMMHINENSIFPDEQFGFRHGHSTTHQLVNVTNSIKSNKSEGYSTGVALLDIEKAFDSVWHKGLIAKMSRFNFPIYLTKMVQNYLSDRTLQVSYQNSKSDRLPVRAGVPQGSILGPILYNIFTSDLPDISEGRTRSLFADDTLLSAKGRSLRVVCSRLQNTLNEFLEYLKKWKISPNASKTQLILFPHKPRALFLIPNENHSITFNGVSLEWSDQVKYLGLTLDRTLTFKDHIETIQTKCNKYIKSLYSLINRNSRLCLKNKMLIYKQIFRPAIMYAVPIWSSCCQTRKKALQRIQNKVLKMILKLPPWFGTDELHRIANIESNV